MGVTILRNASVLDPERGELAEGQSVAVEDGRIADVGPGLTGPDDALVIDVGRRTVMPGLIDAHTHPAIVDADVFAMAEWSHTYVAARAGRALEVMLSRGFTTIRDVGAGEHGLARAVDEGYFTGPRMRFGGKQLSQTGGAGDYRAPSRRVYEDNYYAPTIGVICDGVPEVRKAVREEVRRGAHHIKVYLSGAVDAPSDRIDSTQISIEELNAIVEEATVANIYVPGDAYTARANKLGLEHLLLRARLLHTGHQLLRGVRRALHPARQPDGRIQHPAVQEAWRLLRADDRGLSRAGGQVPGR